MPIILEVLGSCGHRKYADLTPGETERLIASIENGQVEGLARGSYFVLNKNTKRVVGKLDIKDNQELVMMPQIRGG